MPAPAGFAIALVAHAAALVHAAPTPASDTVTYVVRRDETLLEIGHRALEPLSAYREVQQLNHIANDRRIPIGFRLLVPRRVLKTVPTLATVEGVRGGATLAGAPGGSGALAVGTTLQEGAVILTGENAFVRLSLPDGSHLAIPSNSRVRLERLRAVILTGGIDREVSVQAGGLDSQVTPMQDPSSRFVVVTPVGQSAVRGTEFQVAYDPSQGRAGSSVYKGAVGVSNARASATPHAGEGAVASAAGIKGPLPLLPAPELVAGGAVQSGETMRIALKPVAGAVRYRLVLASDPKAEAPLFDRTVDRPAADFPPLPDGAYTLRASAISRDGLEGLPGLIPVARMRGDLSIVGAQRAPDGAMEFRWSLPGETPAAYRFVLARQDDRRRPLVDRDDLAEPHVSVPGLAPGDYVWTVSATRTLGESRVRIVSDPQPLHVP